MDVGARIARTALAKTASVKGVRNDEVRQLARQHSSMMNVVDMRRK